MSDHNRKTLRSFYCRDYLWDLFEVMTRDLGCSMDYLINESMRHYARSRNYSFSQGMPGGGERGLPPHQPAAGGGYGQGAAPGQHNPPNYGQQGMGSYGRGMDHPTFQRMPAVQTNRPAPSNPYAQPAAGYQQQPAQPAQPAAGGYQPAHRMSPPPPPPPPRMQPAAAPQYNSGPAMPPPPPQPQIAPQAAPQAAGRPTLTLVFNNQRHGIDKDKFIIGRGSTMTDLTIRDGNISRKHAAIIDRSGAYYIKDLDSTNGIDYRGERIDSKKVEEGDTFNICDYELRFTYK